MQATPPDDHPASSQEGAQEDLPDVDELVVEGREPPSARVPLSRERIIAAAVEAIDEEGLGSLTMRRLGARLGVEAMSLYRYVPGREDLLDGVVDALVTACRDLGTAVVVTCSTSCAGSLAVADDVPARRVDLTVAAAPDGPPAELSPSLVGGPRP